MENKPKFMKCNKCGKVFEFNDTYFAKSYGAKYGLEHCCKICYNFIYLKRKYKKKGIIFNNFEDISPEQWWEYCYQGIIRFIPEFCNTNENIKKIIRYVLLEKIICKNKGEICNILNRQIMKHYKIYELYRRQGTILKLLQLSFPELNIKNYDLPRVYHNDESKDYILTKWIRENNLSTLDLLSKGITYKFNKEIDSIKVNQFNSNNTKMFLWYFDKNNILHPINKTKITIHDFEEKPKNYWLKKENRIYQTRRYCELKGINNVLYSSELLTRWISDNFRQNILEEDGLLTFNYYKYVDSYYDLLLEAYPGIVNDIVLSNAGISITYDGVICDSFEEKDVYEFIKLVLNLHIKFIGRNKNGKYVFNLSKEEIDNKYCPDFVIEYIKINGDMIKLDKPIIIEYFGMYSEDSLCQMNIDYNLKTKRKVSYFSNLDNIHFIDLYPFDLKYNYKGVENKIMSLINKLI